MKTIIEAQKEIQSKVTVAEFRKASDGVNLSRD
jgi:hypothetical protein